MDTITTPDNKYQFILPYSYKIEIEDKEEGTSDLVYIEYFKEPVAEEVIQTSIDMFDHLNKIPDNPLLMKCTPSKSRKKIRMDISGPSQNVYSYLVGEFLMKSRIGKLSLSELLLQAGANQHLRL